MSLFLYCKRHSLAKIKLKLVIMMFHLFLAFQLVEVTFHPLHLCYCGSIFGPSHPIRHGQIAKLSVKFFVKV